MEPTTSGASGADDERSESVGDMQRAGRRAPKPIKQMHHSTHKAASNIHRSSKCNTAHTRQHAYIAPANAAHSNIKHVYGHEVIMEATESL